MSSRVVFWVKSLINIVFALALQARVGGSAAPKNE